MRNIDNVFKNFKAKTSNRLTGTIIGHQRIGKKTVKVFISSYKPITRLSAARLIAEKTNNSVISYPESLVVTRADKYVGSICCYKASKKYLFDTSKLSKISANSFLDTDLGETWTKDDEDGTTVFYRKNDDDINKVISELSLQASSYMKANVVLPEINKDCFVKVFTFNNEPNLLIGKVLKSKGNMSIIEFGSIKKQIPNPAIIKAYPYAKTKKDVVEFDRQMEQPRGVNPEYDRAMDKMSLS